MPPPRRIDATALAGLAHPLRVRLVEALTVHGPATASDLGRRLGESSGATSYHLRQLERHGFVEEDPVRGTRRERWWRIVRGTTTMRGADFEDDPAMARAHRLVVDEWERGRRARHSEWLATSRDWPQEWRDAGAESTTNLRLTAQEAAQLSRELMDVLVGWAERFAHRLEGPAAGPDDEAACGVEVQVNLFPTDEPPARVRRGE